MDRWTTKPIQNPVINGIDEHVAKKTHGESILEL